MIEHRDSAGGMYLLPRYATVYEHKPWWVFWRGARTVEVDIHKLAREQHGDNPFRAIVLPSYNEAIRIQAI